MSAQCCCELDRSTTAAICASHSQVHRCKNVWHLLFFAILTCFQRFVLKKRRRTISATITAYMWLEKTTSFDLWTQQWPRKYFCVSLHNLSMNITLIFGTVYKYFWSVFLVSVKITRPRHHPVNIIILSFRERFQTFSWQVFTFLTFLNSNFNSFTSLSRPILNQYKISKR